MTIPSPVCPSCTSPLVRTSEGDFDYWNCPDGHGLAASLTEVHGYLQDDEINELWQAARSAHSAGGRACGFCGLPMVGVRIGVDGDEATNGELSDTADTAEVWVDVCLDCQMIWFDQAELEQFPRDLPNPEASAEELAALAQVRSDFSTSIGRALAQRNRNPVIDRILARRR